MDASLSRFCTARADSKCGIGTINFLVTFGEGGPRLSRRETALVC
jgi:hypothetical protein